MSLPVLSTPGWLRDLAGAWIFYSVLPAWPWPAPRFERIARFAPWIGALLGGLQALLWQALEGRVPLLAQVALVLAVGLLLTGGLHMDGAMDTADGLAAGEQRCLEAMADSRVGASGAQAMVLLLLLRAAALATLGVSAPPLLLWSAIWGRLSPLLAIECFPYLRRDGTAGFHRGNRSALMAELCPTALLIALLLPISARFGAPPPLPVPLFLLLLSGCLPAVLVPLWLGRRLGGHTGDSYGACLEWSEALALLLAAFIALAGSAAG